MSGSQSTHTIGDQKCSSGSDVVLAAGLKHATSIARCNCDSLAYVRLILVDRDVLLRIQYNVSLT